MPGDFPGRRSSRRSLVHEIFEGDMMPEFLTR